MSGGAGESLLLRWARYYAGESCAVIPIADGDKRPALDTWEKYQAERPTADELRAWFAGKEDGALGIVTGAVSDNLVILDFDGDAWERARDDLLRVFPDLAASRQVETGSGRWHVWLRCADLNDEDGQSLTRRNFPRPDLGEKTAIEFRANGHQTLAPPSLHPSGGRYRFIEKQAPIVMLPNAILLLTWLESWKRKGEQPPREYRPAATLDAEGARPGDDYNARGEVLPVLKAAGWQIVKQRGDVVDLRRPGKSDGISATWNHYPRSLYVFTTNGAPFEADHCYSAFSVYALLEHNGDFRAAAQELAQQGYGKQNGTPRSKMSVAATRAPVNGGGAGAPVNGGDAGAPAQEESNGMLPLPPGAQIDYTLGKEACPWLDNYIAYSKKWSPRAYDAYHEAIGIWLLSVVAARRVVYPFGGPKYTPLYIALAARSGITAKTTTTKIAYNVLDRAGLSFLLTAQDSTPHRFINDLTLALPENFKELPTEVQQTRMARLDFAGQRGWFYDEFGKKVQAMMRENGVMSDFRRLLLKFDDCDTSYEYGTLKRTDAVERPYLALLANLTPSDLFKVAGQGGELWSDGFLARFALLTPPRAYTRNRARFPKEDMDIPSTLFQPLQKWHNKLGKPDLLEIDILDEKGEKIGTRYKIDGFPVNKLEASEAVIEAAYQYHDGLLDLTEKTRCTDLDASYIRFTEKAWRIAALFASFAGGSTIEIQHWARAQAITEHWRMGLHNLYEQVNHKPEKTQAAEIEDKILNAIEKLSGQGDAAPTAREIGLYIHGYGTTDIEPYLKSLVAAGVLESVKRTRSTGYKLSVD